MPPPNSVTNAKIPVGPIRAIHDLNQTKPKN